MHIYIYYLMWVPIPYIILCIYYRDAFQLYSSIAVIISSSEHKLRITVSDISGDNYYLITGLISTVKYLCSFKNVTPVIQQYCLVFEVSQYTSCRTVFSHQICNVLNKILQFSTLYIMPSTCNSSTFFPMYIPRIPEYNVRVCVCVCVCLGICRYSLYHTIM